MNYYHYQIYRKNDAHETLKKALGRRSVVNKASHGDYLVNKSLFESGESASHLPLFVEFGNDNMLCYKINDEISDALISRISKLFPHEEFKVVKQDKEKKTTVYGVIDGIRVWGVVL